MFDRYFRSRREYFYIRSDEDLFYSNERILSEFKRPMKKISNARVIKADMSDVIDQKRSDISFSSFVECNGEKMVIGNGKHNYKLVLSNFVTSNISSVNFIRCALDGASFGDTDTGFFYKCSLKGSDFEGRCITNCRFVDCDLRGSSFRKCKMANVTFINCDMRNADLLDLRNRERAKMRSDALGNIVNFEDIILDAYCRVDGANFRNRYVSVIYWIDSPGMRGGMMKANTRLDLSKADTTGMTIGVLERSCNVLLKLFGNDMAALLEHRKIAIIDDILSGVQKYVSVCGETPEKDVPFMFITKRCYNTLLSIAKKYCDAHPEWKEEYSELLMGLI
jgi:uncharacterized protein YjbI with pentapeptide repeats